ncbi:MAG: hypothetical protein G01um101430_205 [Parcubacteria group bacterium Gr01-1014_30]|nr:MAG: hypothetical protein G01um101430_205 [Parcubacteria group bacterium Gr01-1014_30]
MRKRYRKPHRHRRRKSIFKRKFFWVSSFTLASFAGLLYLFIFSDFFQVAGISVQGQESELAQHIEDLVEGRLEKKFLFIGSRSIFLVNSGKLREVILQKFPQVGELEIEKTFPNILNLALAERQEVGVFCFTRRSFSEGGLDNCFLLDKNGVIFAPATEDLTLPKLSNLTLETEPTLGSKVIDQETLNIILELEKNLKNISPEEFLLVSTERLNVKTQDGFEVYFSLKKSLGEQITALLTLLESALPPEKRTLLEYIDLRFDRIFVYPAL